MLTHPVPTMQLLIDYFAWVDHMGATSEVER